jgi:gas vesicle protein
MFVKKLALTASVAALAAFISLAPKAFADETTGDKVKQDAEQVKTSTKKLGREASDKTCEMVNGKMQCAGKKVKHSLQNTGDAAKDKVDKTSDEMKQ